MSQPYPVFTLRPAPQTDEEKLIARIDAVLPQTQCTQCGFDGCRPYAAALATGQAHINQCPPGGDAGIHTLATLLQRPYLPLDQSHGVEKPREVAFIDEQTCIGCTLCIQACPVDAIVGAAKLMHTIVADLCTGCELCIPPCPVDCISMQPVSAEELARDRSTQWREQHDFHLYRIARARAEKPHKASSMKAPAEEAAKPAAELMAADAKKALIAAAMERARQQRESTVAKNTEPHSDRVKAEIEAIEARRAAQHKD